MTIMLDTGATGNFIHHKTVQKINEKTWKKAKSYQLQVADGTKMAFQQGSVTHEVRTIMKMENFKEALILDVTDTGSCQVILGTPFLDLHSPG